MINSEERRKDTRLLEVLDHLDPEYIDEVIDILKLPPANASPEPDRRNTILSAKRFLTLAACLFLISACIPGISYIIRYYLIGAGRVEETTAEESTVETEAETTAPEIFVADGFNYHVREDGTLSVYYRGKAEEIVVPEEIDGKKVTAIAAKGFVTAADTLKKVTLPETIEQIGEQAFANCTLLSEINLPDSLTSIGVWAFDHCTSLKNLRIPAHAFDGGFDEAFVYSGLETVELAEGIEKIPLNTFYKSNLKEITLPSSLREIGACAFLECHYLATVNMNEGLEKIGDFAFMNIGAEEINIPASVNTIGKGAFMSCWGLKSITVDQGNKTFYTWGNCVINRNTKTLVIGYGECVLPSDGSVTAIGDSAMGGTPITDLTIPASVTAIGNGAFSLCTRLKSISLPTTLKSIGAGAFGGCTSLESIALPYGIKTVGETTFSGCTSLKSIDIPYGIEFIGEQAFALCEKLTEIYLPDSLTEIGKMAFYYCTSLKKVTVPTSVTVIPERLFNGCSSLEKVTVSSNTASIGAYAFASCPKLTKFIFSGTANEWYGVQTELTWDTSSAFDSIRCLDGIISLHTEPVDNGTPGLQYMLNSDGSSAALVSIGDCTETDIVIASLYNGYPVTVIGTGVFDGKKDITSVQIPDTVTTIGSHAFNGCTSLTSLRLPKGVTKIDAFAFFECTSLSDINIPASVTYIGRCAFEGCPIPSVTLPDGMTYIGGEAFKDCTSLTSVTLPRGITWLYSDTFNNCTALTNLSFRGSIAEWKAIDKDKTWNAGAAFFIVHCSDGDIEADIMTGEEAIAIAEKHLNVKNGDRDDATGYKIILWVKREPRAATPNYIIALSNEVNGVYYPIVKEIYVDIYSGECSPVMHELADIPENIRAVIKNEKTFILENRYTVYFCDQDNYAVFTPEWSSSMDYVVVDLDGDGIEEMVLDGASDTVLILHDTGKEVRGYVTRFRNMLDIKTDGTHEWTDLTISGEYGISRITEFTDDGYKVEGLCHIHQDEDDNVTYFVGGKEVSKEEYDAFRSTLSTELAERKHLDYYPTEKKPEM